MEPRRVKPTEKFPPCRIPADLRHPAPLDGRADAPRTEQKPEELDGLIAAILALDADPLRVLTIGAHHGGVEWHLARRAHEAERRLSLVVVDVRFRAELSIAIREIRAKFGADVRFIKAKSESVTAEQIGAMDAAFIDGDHSYDAVRRDFALARLVGAKLIAAHDIVESEFSRASGCEVQEWWTELERACAGGFAPGSTTRIVASGGGDWGGIGVWTAT